MIDVALANHASANGPLARHHGLHTSSPLRTVHARMWFLYLLQTLFSVALTGGFYLWWVLDHVGHGHRPEDGFLRWWHGLDGQPEFHLLLVQMIYPLLWWLSRKVPWPPFWRAWRTMHLALVLLLVLAAGLLWLATPDLGGNWG